MVMKWIFVGRFLLLLNEFVPISMYVTLELVKVVQCLYVNWDIHMFYHDTNTLARARASGLTEELGQVSHMSPSIMFHLVFASD